MRVPLYAHDLEIKGGFKRITKELQKNWPHLEPIKLVDARETLARALGYQSYFQAHRSVCLLPQKKPDLQPAKERLKAMVSTYLKDKAVSCEVIGEMVEALPWHALLATSIERSVRTCMPKGSPRKEARTPHREISATQENQRPAPIIITKRRRMTIGDVGGAI